ncbi:hypothetical protein ACF0H5_003188 [Mactra antiquata]
MYLYFYQHVFIPQASCIYTFTNTYLYFYQHVFIPLGPCIYNGKEYLLGETWEMDCDFCDCDDDRYGAFSCYNRCSMYSNIPPGCTLVPSVYDPCCKEIDCSNAQHTAQLTVMPVTGLTVEPVAETTVKPVAETTGMLIAETTAVPVARTTVESVAETTEVPVTESSSSEPGQSITTESTLLTTQVEKCGKMAVLRFVSVIWGQYHALQDDCIDNGIIHQDGSTWNIGCARYQCDGGTRLSIPRCHNQQTFNAGCKTIQNLNDPCCPIVDCSIAIATQEPSTDSIPNTSSDPHVTQITTMSYDSSTQQSSASVPPTVETTSTRYTSSGGKCTCPDALKQSLLDGKTIPWWLILAICGTLFMNSVCLTVCLYERLKRKMKLGNGGRIKPHRPDPLDLNIAGV